MGQAAIQAGVPCDVRQETPKHLSFQASRLHWSLLLVFIALAARCLDCACYTLLSPRTVLTALIFLLSLGQCCGTVLKILYTAFIVPCLDSSIALTKSEMFCMSMC